MNIFNIVEILVQINRSGLSNLNFKIYLNFIYICNLKDLNMQFWK